MNDKIEYKIHFCGIALKASVERRCEMREMALFLLIVVLVVCGCSRSQPSAEEMKALAMLQSVQGGIETNPSVASFTQLLGQAESELTLLKQNPKTNPCFLNALEKSYASCQIAGKALQKKLETQDPVRQQDFDMALTFSTAFAAVSIQRAVECYAK
jgi:hypothetical protein